MSRIGSFAQNQALLGGLARQQLDLAQSQTQVQTGKKSHDLQGLAKEATTLVSARSLKARYDSYETTARTLGLKLTAVDAQMEQMVEAARSLRESVFQAVSNNSGIGLGTIMEQHLRTAIASLNADVGGEFLFAGARITQAPVAITSMADLQALPAIGDAFRNDTLKASAKLADNLDVQHGQLASELGTPFFSALRTLADFNAGPSGPFADPLTPDQAAFLTSQLAPLDAVIGQLQTRQMENGLTQNRTDALRQDMTERAKALEIFIGEIEDVDIAEAVSRLQADQTALEASYRVLGSLTQLSLARFL
jgi:flagellar hook-associated protein 3 FlgL